MHTFRALDSSDVPTFRRLLAVFGEAFEDVPTYCDAQPSDDYLAAFLGKQHVLALVAEDEEQLIGGLVAYELEKFEQERREIYIYDLAVDAAHRRQGVARSLIQLLQRLAAERGAYVIFVQADPGDDPAIALYESLGTREDVHHFDIQPAA